MKTITSVAIAALMLGLAACGQNGSGATGTKAAETSATTPSVTFQAQPALAEGVEALPRLVGDSPSIQAINADLQQRDTAARAGGCEGGGGFERGVMQPMTGPGYITFWIAEGYYCEGSAHPSFEQTVITYDLATGQPVDWAAIAPGLGLTQGATALTAWYSARVVTDADPEWLADCRTVLTPEALEGTTFKVWLDAENGGLSVGPDLAHVVQACADTRTMTAADMRQFGLPAAMIEAVTAAHAAGNWAPKEDAEAETPTA